MTSLAAKTYRRTDIQILRGVSVIAVILFHLNPKWFPNGYLGVDAFFVVSGFVVAPLVLRIFESSDLPSVWSKLALFYRSRYFRLAPALGVTLILSTLFLFVFGPIQDHRFFSAQGIAAIFLLSNVQAARLSGDNYFQPNPNALLHTWSLSVEEQIYLIFPLVMLFIFIFLKRKLLLVPTAIFLVSYLFYFHILRQETFFLFEMTPGQLYYSPVSRLWEFAIGAILASKISFRVSKYFSFISFLIFITLIFTRVELGFFSPELICIFVSITLAINLEVKEKNLLVRTLVWIGDRSYSLYLVHLPIIYLSEHSRYVPQINPNFYFVIPLIGTFLAGQILWYFIEFRFRIKTFNNPRLTWKKGTLIFTLVPLVLLSMMRIGSTNYYGLTNEPKIQGTISCVDPGSFGECISSIDNPKGNYLLMGDSHAAALSQTFISVMNNQGMNAVVMSGRGCQTYGTSSADLGCGEYRTGALKYLKNNPDTQVLVVQRSSSIQSMETHDEYLMQILIGLKEISKVAHSVTVFGPNPEYPSGNSQGYFLDLFQRQGDFPAKKMIRNSFLDDEFYKANLQLNGIKYVSTSDKFCKNATCKYKVDNSLLYWDEDHLSLAGAKYLSPLLEDLVDKN